MAPQQRERSFGSAELWEPLRKAGFARPTLLQRKVVPLIQSGRDLVVEVEGDTGRTAAFILPILARLKRGKAGIKAVVATSSAEDSRKVQREFQRFCRPQAGRSVSFFALGVEERDRGEHRSLSKQPEVLIGTPSRIIDHIRRGNLDFSHVQSVVIDRQEPEPGFADDLKFIFSKLPPRKQVLLFSRATDAGPDGLLELLRRPVHLSLAAWKQSGEKVEELFVEVDLAQKPRAVAALALSERAGVLLVQASSRDYARKLGRELAERGLAVQVLWEAMREPEQERIRQQFAEGHRVVLVSTFEAVRRQGLRWATHVLNADPPPSREAYRPASVVLEKIITLGSAAQQLELQERFDVKLEKSSLPDDDQVLAGAIGEILRRLRAEEDPGELARYLRLLRRHAPLGRRAAVAAYLLKQLYGGLGAPAAPRGPQPPRRAPGRAGGAKPGIAGAKPGIAGAKPGIAGAKPGTAGAQAAPAGPRAQGGAAGGRAAPGPRRRGRTEKAPPLAERARAKAGFTRLFISVGKSRGVYAKDLAALFSDRLQIDRGRIGDIRVLDNYSFLEIESGLAEKAIAALSGSELKGRQISVNYARKKEDE
jgi:ATP-dependent RNA helicase DeaD